MYKDVHIVSLHLCCFHSLLHYRIKIIIIQNKNALKYSVQIQNVFEMAFRVKWDILVQPICLKGKFASTDYILKIHSHLWWYMVTSHVYGMVFKKWIWSSKVKTWLAADKVFASVFFFRITGVMYVDILYNRRMLLQTFA